MDWFPPQWLVHALESFQRSTGFPDYVNTHLWIWPVSETLHFIGLCLLVGTIGVFDLRMLGVGKALPLNRLQRLVPWGVLGFAICAATGTLFVLANFFSINAYLYNGAFKWKMALILLSGLNVLIFSASGAAKSIDGLGPGADAPASAKATAAASLLLWVSVIFLGRFLPIIGDAF